MNIKKINGKERKLKIIGLVGSYRKMGNTEILVKAALNKAKESGAEVELIRLTDLNILPCRGCYICVRLGKGCQIDDDMGFLLSKFAECDGLILGVPVYVYTFPAICKLILDRVYMVRGDYQKYLGKKAGVIAVGAMDAHYDLVIPMAEMFLKCFFFHPVSLIEIKNALGPGYVLLDPKNIEKARSVGLKIMEAIQKGYYENNKGCSFCRKDFVKIKSDSIQCPFCGRKGKLSGYRILWDSMENKYLSDINDINYFISDILIKGKWTKLGIKGLKKYILDIAKKKKEYMDENMGIKWSEVPRKKEVI